MAQTATTGVMPTINDVVCGRGRTYDRLEGNQTFRRLVKAHATAYSNSHSTSCKRKSLIVKSIREELSKKEAMRFLKAENGVWHEMNEKEIKLKIGHALRDARAAVVLPPRYVSPPSSAASVDKAKVCDDNSVATALADHDNTAKPHASDQQVLLRNNELTTMVNTDYSDVVGDLETCQERGLRPSTPEQRNVVEDRLMMSMLRSSPPTKHKAALTLPSTLVALPTSEICSIGDSSLHLLASTELGNSNLEGFFDDLSAEDSEDELSTSLLSSSSLPPDHVSVARATRNSMSGIGFHFDCPPP